MLCSLERLADWVERSSRRLGSGMYRCADIVNETFRSSILREGMVWTVNAHFIEYVSMMTITGKHAEKLAKISTRYC